MVRNEKLIRCVKKFPCLYNNKLQSYRIRSVKQKAWETIGQELNVPGEACKKQWIQLRGALLHALGRRKKAEGKMFQKWKYNDEMAFLLPFITPKYNNLNEEEINKANDRENESQTKDEKDEYDLFFECIAKTVKKLPAVEKLNLKLEILKLVNAAEMRNLERDSDSEEDSLFENSCSSDEYIKPRKGIVKPAKATALTEEVWLDSDDDTTMDVKPDTNTLNILPSESNTEKYS